MPQSHPLDKVIRRLESSWLPAKLEPEERVVIFDARAGKALAKKPFFPLGKDIRYYLVNTRRQPVECPGPTCRIKSISTRLSIEIDVSYEAHCERGSEERLVAALIHAENPATAIDRFIADRVQDFVTNEGTVARDACLEFLQIRGALQFYIAERARNELGIVMEVLARPKLEDELQPVPVKTGYLPMRVRDHDDHLELRITTDLEVDPLNRMRALLFFQQAAELESTVQQVVRRVLAEEITLHAFTYELTTKVRRRLMEALNERLAEHGRRIAYLQLESRTPGSQAAGSGEIEHSVACKIADCEEPIAIKHRLKLSLNDLGCFRASGVRNLEAWATEKLEEITRDVLFEKRYLDLLLEFRPDEMEIKARVEREVREIGYTVKQLVTAPALEPLRWRGGFLLEDVEGVFGTRDSRIDVRLNVVIKGKIIDLRNPKLQKYLTPQSTIFADIKEVVLREVRQMVHGVSPEHFYMRFSYSDDPDQPSVQDMIETRITAVLAEQFVIEDIGVIPKPLETDLTKRLERLKQGPHKLVVACTPLNRGGEEVEYRIDFDILGVPPERWYVFRAKSYSSIEEELDRIREVIAEDVKSKLQVAPREILQFTEMGRYHDLIQVIQSSVRDKVERVFGLRIQIINMNRLATYGELKAKDATKHAIDTSMETGTEILGRKKSDLLMLYGKRSEMIASGVESEDPILSDLEQRIRGLEAEISPDQLERGQQEVKALLPDISLDSKSEEWKRLALTAPADHPSSELARLTGSVEEETS